MVDDRDPERPRVFERRAHELCADHGPPVVAHRDRPGADHFPELGKRLAALAE